MKKDTNKCVKIKRLPGNTFPLPARKMSGDVGFDLYCMDSISVAPDERANIPLGVCVELPSGYAAEIKPRSSSNSRGLFVYQGLIDNGYRGPLYAFIQNMSNEKIKIARGDRVVQLVLVPIVEATAIEVDELSESERGDKGFGSSGF